MTVVSSKEFATKPTKYYNLAVNEKVAIKRGEKMFHLICTNGHNTNEYDEILEPDEDLNTAITIDVLFDKVKENILNKYVMK